MNSLLISQIYFQFGQITSNSLFFSRIYIEFTMFLTNFLRIHFLFHAFTFNPLSFSFFLIPYLCKLTSNSLFFENVLSIQYLYLELTWNARIYFPFTFYFVNSNWIQFLFNVFIFNSLSFSRKNFEFTIYFAKSLRKTTFLANQLEIH